MANEIPCGGKARDRVIEDRARARVIGRTRVTVRLWPHLRPGLMKELWLGSEIKFWSSNAVAD